MLIPFNHVGLYAKGHKKTILAKIAEIIEAGIFFDGAENKLLIRNLVTYLDEGLVTITASGHDALFLSLLSLSLSGTDEVIFPVNAYPTAFPIVQSGAKPVPVDVDRNGQIDPLAVEKRVNKNTKAIIVVHLYGAVGDFDKIQVISRLHHLVLIEDCAQAFGAYYRGKVLGTLGDIGCFSFYPTKNIGTLGDGGAIVTKNKNIHEFLTKARSYGERSRYMSDFIAGHSRMPEIQKAIVNVYFKHLEKETKKRKWLASYYEQSFDKRGLSQRVSFLRSSPGSDAAPHLMVVTAKKRDELRAFLAKKKIPTLIHYPHPIHLLPAFAFLNLRRGDFPMAEALSKKIVSLPFHTFLSEKEIDHIAESIKEFYETTK